MTNRSSKSKISENSSQCFIRVGVISSIISNLNDVHELINYGLDNHREDPLSSRLLIKSIFTPLKVVLFLGLGKSLLPVFPSTLDAG